jgi:hypothetical protein
VFFLFFYFQILGNNLYIPPLNASLHPLPSPNKLKNKFLLRGKTNFNYSNISLSSKSSSKKYLLKNLNENDKKLNRGGGEGRKNSIQLTIDSNFGKLIALPSVKVFFIFLNYFFF